MTEPATIEVPVAASRGVSAVLRAPFIAFGHKRLRRHVLVAFVANALVFGLIWWGLFAGADALSTAMAGDGDGAGWMSWLLGWALWLLFVVAGLLLSPMIFRVVAALVLSLWNGAIFDATRQWAGAPESDRNRGLNASVAVSVALRRLVRFALFTLVIMGLTLLLMPIPLLNAAVATLGLCAQFLLAASTLGWDIHSPHLELKGMDFDAQRDWVRSHRVIVTSMGCVAALLLMVPGLNLVFITTNTVASGMVSAWYDGADQG